MTQYWWNDTLNHNVKPRIRVGFGRKGAAEMYLELSIFGSFHVIISDIGIQSIRRYIFENRNRKKIVIVTILASPS